MSRRPLSSQPSSHPMRDRRYRRYRPRLVMKRAWPPELKLMKDVRRLVVMVALSAVLLPRKLRLVKASLATEMLAVPALAEPAKVIEPPSLTAMVALPAVLLTEKPTEPLLLTTMLALLAVLVASNIVEPLLLMMLAVPAVLAPVKFVS